jgi:predicted MFS family arabinose efflux permease
MHDASPGTGEGRPRRGSMTLSRGWSFVAAACVLVIALWASGAPAMVYPLYAQQYDVSEFVTTALFALYPVTLVASLILWGALSDTMGRRRVLLIGVSIVAVGTVPFVFMDHLVALFAGRGLQGVGVGIAMGAASAALVEHSPRHGTTFASSINTTATASGTAISLLLGGAVVEYAPAPTRLPFAALLTATLGLLCLLWFLADTGLSHAKSWRPTPLHLPTVNRGSFWLGVVSISVGFVMGAVILAVGAQIARDLVGAENALLAALPLASWAVAILPASMQAQRREPHQASLIGGVLAVFGLAAMMLAAGYESLAVFVLATIVSGASYGLMFYGGIGLVNEAALREARAATLSTMYLVAYFAQGTTAVVIGWAASVWGLAAAMAVGLPVIAVLSIGVTILTVVNRRHRGTDRPASG